MSDALLELEIIHTIRGVLNDKHGLEYLIDTGMTAIINIVASLDTGNERNTYTIVH